MIKKFLIALTFVSAFAFVSVGVPEKAEAWRRWGRPYVTYYSAPPRAYYGDFYGGRPYRTYYGGPAFYRSYYRPYYRPYYRGYYNDYSGYYYGPGSGVSVSVGF
jgi:hypothetical protein